ncbi:DUF1566 domain-containing protein [Leptospira yasudae]|uniref:Lcl C-terminal domain-containing protein n=1 Tax=Leptospira yasudae TaxID=2202201 RepID=UPI001090D46C|nr:DUF1566 domain-containing protein [Leptospira yasudae]TGN00514.1 DUF1566 domain-containing protein [Leptospira yasudae]
MRTKMYFRFSLLYFITFVFLLANCKPKLEENICDPNSKAYLESAFLSSGSGGLYPFCGPAPTSLSYPTAVFANGSPISLSPNAVGNGLSYSVSPALPTGVFLDPIGGGISGSYIGYAGIDSVYQIKAANSAGSITYSLELILYGPPPLKTGQTSCWDGAGTAISCSGTGQDGELQNGSTSSLTGPTNVTGTDYTTTDNLSGLIWKSCEEGQTGSTCTGAPSSLSWAASLTACTSLNSPGYGNRTDWRLASLREYATMLNYSGSSPATYTSFFPNANGVGHWSSDRDPNAPGTQSVYVSFTDGIVGLTIQGNTNDARCVSGSALPSLSFKNNGDSTITDINTGLIWMQCTVGHSGSTCNTGIATSLTWSNALTACNSSTQGGRRWRLPSVNELRSILDLSVGNPSISGAYFPNTLATNYWTSTSYTNPADAWVIHFGASNNVMNLTKPSVAYARCVSTGP